MKRLVTAALTVLVAAPAVASADVKELGEMTSDVHGSCPVSCTAVSRTTGYQVKVGPDRTLYQAPADGRIVAWTVALGKPGPKQTAFFNKGLGGVSRAAVVVLAAGKKLSNTVVAKSRLVELQPYFGTTVEFPLDASLPIKKGQYVALTVPTWAPLLQIGLGNDTSWRSSRPVKSCLDVSTQSALVGSHSFATFGCLYRTARLTFSATFIPTPKGATTIPATTTPPKKPATR
jgi:hypothetical protein